MLCTSARSRRLGRTRYSLHNKGIDDHLGAFVPVTKALAVKLRKGRVHLVGRRDRDCQRGIATGSAQPCAATVLNAIRMHALLNQRLACTFVEISQGGGEILAQWLKQAC